MGKMLSCCSRSSTIRYSEVYRSPSTDTRFSEPSQTSQSESTLEKRKSRSLEQGICGDSKRVTCVPKLKCLIVPSFGEKPPDNIAPKKAASDFLQGVGDDLKIIQDWISKDSQKELVNVTLMCHFEQVKVAAFTTNIKDIMNNISLECTNDDQKGCK